MARDPARIETTDGKRARLVCARCARPLALLDRTRPDWYCSVLPPDSWKPDTGRHARHDPVELHDWQPGPGEEPGNDGGTGHYRWECACGVELRFRRGALTDLFQAALDSHRVATAPGIGPERPPRLRAPTVRKASRTL